jgi:hypothetical protein
MQGRMALGGLTCTLALVSGLGEIELAVQPWSAEGPAPAPVLFASGTISTGDDEAHPTFSPDGRRLFYIKNTPDFRHWTIVAVDWTARGWGKPEIASFSGQYADADLSFAPDGRAAYFVSTRPVTVGGAAKEDTDLWRIPVGDGGAWGEPQHLAEISSDGSEWFPNATTDGWLYFGSERREGNLGSPGTSDLWRARLVGTRYAAPENLGPVINTAGNDIEPWVSADGRVLIFSSSGRPDTRGSYDLYVSHRCGEKWTEPRNLGEDVNSPDWEFGARPTPDLRFLFFTSNRTWTRRPPERRLSFAELTGKLRAPGNGLRDIYRVEMAALPLASTCAEPPPAH